MADGSYQSIPHVTGPDVRAAEVPDMPFPELLHPVDDLPPATIITSATRHGAHWLVRGVSEDNTNVASVDVNGTAARIVTHHAGVADWEASIDSPETGEISAFATDTSGNVEHLPAHVSVSGAPATGAPQASSSAEPH